MKRYILLIALFFFVGKTNAQTDMDRIGKILYQADSVYDELIKDSLYIQFLEKQPEDYTLRDKKIRNYKKLLVLERVRYSILKDSLIAKKQEKED